jgi:hypothetical protein
VVTQTVNVVQTSSGNGFAYWTINGQRASDAAGQSPTSVTCVMTNNVTAIAWYMPISQSTNGSGIPDYIEFFYYGSATNGGNSDTDGDGFTLSQELARGYDPVIPDITINGGEVMRLSDSFTYDPPTNPEVYYVIESQPQGIIPTISGYVPTNTPIQTTDVTYGVTSNYGFEFWALNGVRQAGPSGAALTQITLPMTNDETAIAEFFPPTQSSNGGLPDWYQYFWFGNANQSTNSDPTGDGFTIADDLERGYSPVVTNSTVNGGEVVRLSSAVSYYPPPYLQPPYFRSVVITISSGQIVLEWSQGGILQSAPSLTGQYTAVVGAVSPYPIVPSGSQMFFRVEFP